MAGRYSLALRRYFKMSKVLSKPSWILVSTLWGGSVRENVRRLVLIFWMRSQAVCIEASNFGKESDLLQIMLLQRVSLVRLKQS